MPTLELLIGTGNPGKVTEITRALKDLPLHLRLTSDFPNLIEPDENGSSYAQNATIKAHSYATQTGLHTLADDSGIEVDSLDGFPGLRSARFGGEGLSDADRTSLLLSKLSTVDHDKRSARFVCAMVIAKPSGEVINEALGICSGTIATAPSGDGGFGYDPVFIPTGYQITFASMPFQLKNTLSHRGQALSATHKFLAGFLKSGL